MKDWNQYTEAVFSNITNKLKEARVKQFINKLGLGRNDIVLDLGSEDGSYLSKYYPWPENIVIADINEESLKRGVEINRLKGYKILSESGALPFDNGEFGAVWCNSVIEHVTVNKAILKKIMNNEFTNEADQHQMYFASEIKRIGKKYFVQTPYIHFPIESHSWLPFIQYLSQEKRWLACKSLRKLWVKQWTADFYLYDVTRMQKHFNDATEIYFEKALGMKKSIIVYRR